MRLIWVIVTLLNVQIMENRINIIQIICSQERLEMNTKIKNTKSNKINADGEAVKIDLGVILRYDPKKDKKEKLEEIIKKAMEYCNIPAI